MRTLRTFLRIRPFLWLLGIVLASIAVSFTWEKSTSYDDGGIGTLSFLVLFTIGLPALVPSRLLPIVAKGPLAWLGYLSWPLGFLFLVGFYLWLDRRSQRWLARLETASRAHETKPHGA